MNVGPTKGLLITFLVGLTTLLSPKVQAIGLRRFYGEAAFNTVNSLSISLQMKTDDRSSKW